MKYASLVLLAVSSFWAVAVAAEDLATSRIANRKMIFGARLLLAGLCAQLVVSGLGYDGRLEIYPLWGFYPKLLMHMLWSACAGVILWYAEIWPAGDAKFYIIISALLPLVNPQIRTFPGYLFLTLLINIFVPAAIFAVGGYVFSGMRGTSPGEFMGGLFAGARRRLGELASGENRLAAVFYPFNMVFVFLLQQVLAMEAGGLAGRIFSRVDILYFFIFVLWDKVGAAFRSRRLFYAVSCLYLVYFFSGYFFFYEHLSGMILAALVNVVKFSLLLFFGRFMLGFLMEEKDLECVDAAALAPGMVLSSREAAVYRNNPVFEGAFDDSFRDGLSAEQVALIKDWLKKLPFENAKAEIVRGRPFAVWIALGAAAALLLDKNIALLLR